MTAKYFWSARLFWTNGVTAAGVQVRPPGADRRNITVRVNSGVYGDVVLEGMYESTDQKRVLIRPHLVASLAPSGVTAESFQVVPGDGARYPVNVSVPIEVWTTWSDGGKSRRFIAPANITVTSSAPNVLNVSDPLNWLTGIPGETTITTTFDGKTYIAKWTVYDPAASSPQPSVSLTIEESAVTGAALSWPASISENYILQFADRLGAGANWQQASEAATQVGTRFVVQVTPSSAIRFFRLHRSSP